VLDKISFILYNKDTNKKESFQSQGETKTSKKIKKSLTNKRKRVIITM
jgi:hypothetical protein